MNRWHRIWIGLSLLLMTSGACIWTPAIPLHPGLVIRQSANIRPAEYFLPHTHPAAGGHIIFIKGKDLVIDFQGASLIGSPDSTPHHVLRNTGIHIKNSGNVTLKNLTIKGYRVPIRVDETASVHLENVSISHFFQPEQPDSIPNFEGDNPWDRYGPAILIRQCYQPTLKNLKIDSGGIGVWMEESHSGFLSELKINHVLTAGLAFRNSTQHIVHHNEMRAESPLPPYPAIFGAWSQQNVFGWNNWGKTRHPFNSAENIFFSNTLITSDSTLRQTSEVPEILKPYATESPSGS